MKDYIYYDIKNPEDRVTHISHSEHEAWHKFFDYNGHRLPIAEAIQAYEAIGYKCIQCRLIRADQMENNKMNGRRSKNVMGRGNNGRNHGRNKQSM